MAGLSIKENGLQFVWLCLQNYWGSCLFLLFFAAGILWSLFCHRKQEARIFLGYAVFLILTAYNPFLVSYLVPKIDFENEYYRLFWILPVLPGVAYYAVRLIFALKKRWTKILLTLVFCVVLAAAGTPLQGVVQNFALAENIYKVPNDLRAVCDVIHEDYGKEQPRVIFDGSLNSVAASMTLPCSWFCTGTRFSIGQAAPSSMEWTRTVPGTIARRRLWMSSIITNRWNSRIFCRHLQEPTPITWWFLSPLAVTSISARPAVSRWHRPKPISSILLTGRVPDGSCSDSILSVPKDRMVLSSKNTRPCFPAKPRILIFMKILFNSCHCAAVYALFLSAGLCTAPEPSGFHRIS